MIGTASVKPPLHFWLIAVLAFLWTGFGCLDFTMTATRNPYYLAQFPPEMVDFIDALPAGAVAAWALGVWGALAGSVLLLARSRWAVFAFGGALLGLALSTIYQATAGMSEATSSVGGPGRLPMAADRPVPTGASPILMIFIWVVAIALLWFAIRMRSRGVLR